MKRLASLLFIAAALAACNASAPPPVAAPPPAAAPPPGSVSVTPQGFELPAGGTCAGEIARYRAIQANDLSMGHVAQSVYDQIAGEIAAAEKVCAAGREGEAKAMIVASKQRHGYPVGL